MRRSGGWWLAVLVTATVLVTGGPTPGRSAEAATTSTPNVTHLLNLPTGSGVGGKFAAGYFFHTTADAIPPDPNRPTGPPGGLVVLDVLNPEVPLPAGYLPLPLWQNEDVELSLKRNILLIAQDRSQVEGGKLHVIDITVPRAPILRSSVTFPAAIGRYGNNRPIGGPGHTASCIDECNFAYVSGAGDGSVWVVDLRNVASPHVIGTIVTPAAGGGRGFGSIHDVHTDPTGHVWMMGAGGTALYGPITDPLRPRLLASIQPRDNLRFNQFIHHGALRLSTDTVLITEEAFGKAGCGAPTGRGEFDEDGSLQTWRIDLAGGQLLPLDTWDINVAGADAAKRTCSSHWFDINPHRVVADAWYEGGVRFLDLSDPRNIRQIGWWTGDGTYAGAAQFVPGRPDLVYVSDYQRGLDVLKIEGGGKGAPTTTASAALAPARPGAAALARTLGCDLRAIAGQPDLGGALRV